jgi:hypothetical protein
MDRKAEEETNGSAIRDDGRGPREIAQRFRGVAITKRGAAWAVQAGQPSEESLGQVE